MQTWSHVYDAIRCEPSDVSGYLVRTSGCLIWHDLTTLVRTFDKCMLKMNLLTTNFLNVYFNFMCKCIFELDKSVLNEISITKRISFEPHHEKAGILHMHNAKTEAQINRAANKRLYFRYMNSTDTLLPHSEISSHLLAQFVGISEHRFSQDVTPFS